ncbi:endothelin-converting enzyme 2-like [Babylonia areolata]|uniref:endothelin-converting enzyme 2-like n=1 Tax=Babylonia areolata TaxID=304850 RepID=UPI003FD5B303
MLDGATKAHDRARVASAIDRSVKPCDDFYQFACGRWALNNPPPSVGNQAMDIFVPIANNVPKALRDLMDTDHKGYPQFVEKAQKFYRSCLATDTYDSLMHKPFLDLIHSRGPNVFPTLSGTLWTDENWSLNQIVARVPRYRHLSRRVSRTYSLQMLFPFLTMPDFFQANRSIVFISEPAAPYDSPGIFLGRYGTYLVRRFKLMYTRFARTLGADKAVAARDAEDVMQFFLRVMEFDWLEFLNTEFSSVGINLTMEEEVLTDGVEYFDRIFPVINSTSRSGFPLHQFNSPKRPKPRWRLCLERTNTYFRETVGRLYIDKHFSQAKRTEVEDMVVDLKDAFRDIVRETDWMSQPTKEAALAKLNAMDDKIGYPDHLKNDTFLDEKMKNVTVSKDDMFGNVMRLADHRYRTFLRALRQPVDRRSVATTTLFTAVTV